MSSDVTTGRQATSPAAKGAASEYDREYYDAYGRLGPVPYTRENPQWLSFFGRVANEIKQRLHPTAVLDVGCAKGFLVECLRDRGVEAFGIDVSEYAISAVREDIRQYCSVGSAADPITRQYDLITCIEVCEHLPETEAVEAIRQMTSHSPTILFSSTPGDFSEPTHVNVRPIIDWLRLFAQFSYAPDQSFDASFLSRQAFLVRRVGSPPSDRDLCRFAHAKTCAIANAETEDLRRQLAAVASELEGMLSSKLWKLIRWYRSLRFRIKHPIAQVLRKLNLYPVGRKGREHA